MQSKFLISFTSLPWSRQEKGKQIGSKLPISSSQSSCHRCDRQMPGQGWKQTHKKFLFMLRTCMGTWKIKKRKGKKEVEPQWEVLEIGLDDHCRSLATENILFYANFCSLDHCVHIFTKFFVLQGMGFATIRSCGDAAQLVGRQGCLTQATMLVHLGEKGTTFNTTCEKIPSVGWETSSPYVSFVLVEGASGLSCGERSIHYILILVIKE